MKGWFGAGIRRMLCGVLALGCLGLAGCSREAEWDTAGEGTGAVGSLSEGAGTHEASREENGGSREKVGSGDLQSDSEDIFGQKEGRVIGLQYFQGEALRFRLVDKFGHTWTSKGTPVLDTSADIYLDREDGSSELFVENLKWENTEVFQKMWYLAQDGSIYCVEKEYGKETEYIAKRDGQGALLYEKQLELQVRDICQLVDGSIILLLDDGTASSRYRSAKLDPETGAVTELVQIPLKLGDFYIAAGREGLLVLNHTEGIREIHIEKGTETTVLSFSNTSYELDIWRGLGSIEDIHMLEDGGAEFLWVKEQQCTRESLTWISSEKIRVVMRGFHFNNGWIKTAVENFNRQSEAYFISLEEAGGKDWDDFATQTSIEIASGGGPDILFGEVMSDYIQGMIDKGGLEDLMPYMEASGIGEEDYFPAVFSNWRKEEKIYGINASMFVYRYCMNTSVLGLEQVWDIKTLVDTLCAYDEQAMYMVSAEAGDILEMFLEGSDDFWGMLDWEAGTCDFGGDLFAKMLEAAGRYAYDENQDYPILVEHVYCNDLYSFCTSEHLKEMGKVQVGVMFPDGCHAGVNTAYQTLSINANSTRKQGAWEFIAYLLGEEWQQELIRREEIPASRKAFQVMVDSKLADLHNYTSREIWFWEMIGGEYVVASRRELTAGSITDDWVEAFTKTMEEARCLPIRTQAIMEVVLEEAEDYFNGIKSVEEVVRIIENRVRIYMNEQAGF